jgi:hypothetical protein
MEKETRESGDVEWIKGRMIKCVECLVSFAIHSYENAKYNLVSRFLPWRRSVTHNESFSTGMRKNQSMHLHEKTLEGKEQKERTTCRIEAMGKEVESKGDSNSC